MTTQNLVNLGLTFHGAESESWRGGTVRISGQGNIHRRQASSWRRGPYGASWRKQDPSQQLGEGNNDKSQPSRERGVFWQGMGRLSGSQPGSCGLGRVPGTAGNWDAKWELSRPQSYARLGLQGRFRQKCSGFRALGCQRAFLMYLDPGLGMGRLIHPLPPQLGAQSPKL